MDNNYTVFQRHLLGNEFHLGEEELASVTFYGLILVLSLACNCLSLYLLLCRKHSRPSVKFIYTVLVKNLLLGSAVQILTIVSIFKKSLSEDKLWTHFSAMLFIAYILLSSWSVLLISFDRYIAIHKALQYSNWFTHKACITLIMVIITLSIGGASVQFICKDNSKYYQTLHIFLVQPQDGVNIWKIYLTIITSLGYLLPLIANFLIYISIYIATKNTTALARRNSIQPLIDQPNVKTSPSSQTSSRKSSVDTQLLKPPTRGNGLRRLSGQLKVHKDNRKAAKMGAFVLVEQAFIYLPFYIMLLLQTFGVIGESRWDWLVVACLFCGGITTPVIYVLRTKSSKATMLSWLGVQRNAMQKHQTLQTQSTLLKHTVTSQHSDENI